MSQLPAQAAIAPLAQGVRRNSPVAMPTGSDLQQVQAASIGAPGVPGIAVMPAPVPDMSAARDLEQALRATQALGSTLIQTGNAFNIEQQIAARNQAMSDAEAEKKRKADEAADVYASAMRAVMDSGKFEDRMNKGEFDNLAASTDHDTFVATQTAGYAARTEAGNQYYQRAMANVASNGYIKIQSGIQKKALTSELNGMHAQMLIADGSGPQKPADEVYAEFQQRHPYLDRDTFYESYAKGIEAVAKSGDSGRFNALASSVNDPTMRALYVDPLRPVLANAVSGIESEKMRAVEFAKKQALESSDPFGSRVAQLKDSLAASGVDEGTSSWQLSEFLGESLKRASSMEELHAIDIASDGLPESAKANYESRKKALQEPLSKAWLNAAAVDRTTDYPAIRGDVQGIVGPDDLAIADERYVRRITSERKSNFVTEYLKTGDRVTLEKMLGESFARYDTSKPQWQQASNAIDGTEYVSLLDELNKIDAENQKRDFAGNVLNGTVRLNKPSNEKWDDVLSQAGAVSNGRMLDPMRAADVVRRTGTVPDLLVDAALSDLRGSRTDIERGLTFFGQLAPALNDPNIASQINGFPMSKTEGSANAATMRAINDILPSLARMERDGDGNIGKQDMAALVESFQAAKERAQEAQLPSFDQTGFENQLNAGRIDSLMGVSTVDSQTNRVTVRAVENAIVTAAADRMARGGLPISSATELGSIVAARVIQDSIPAISNVGMSKDVMEQRILGEIDAIKTQFHLPMLEGRGFTGPVDRRFAPNAEWDEKTVTEKLTEQGISPRSVTHAQAAIGTGNTWLFMVEERKKDRQGRIGNVVRFVNVTLPMKESQQARPLTIDEQIDAARERGRNLRKTESVWKSYGASFSP